MPRAKKQPSTTAASKQSTKKVEEEVVEEQEDQEQSTTQNTDTTQDAAESTPSDDGAAEQAEEDAEEAEEVEVETQKSNGNKGRPKGKQLRGKAKKAAKAAKSSKKKSVVIIKSEEKQQESIDADDAEEKTGNTLASAPNDEYRFATGVLISQPTARDVKIGNFSLMAYGKELIKDTTIELTIGRRYGLVGPNGCGKTAFMKCLAKREVICILRIFFFVQCVSFN